LKRFMGFENGGTAVCRPRRPGTGVFYCKAQSGFEQLMAAWRAS